VNTSGSTAVAKVTGNDLALSTAIFFANVLNGSSSVIGGSTLTQKIDQMLVTFGKI
jgi:hypothetical protein